VHWPVAVLHFMPFAQCVSSVQLVRQLVASAQVKPLAHAVAGGLVVQAPVIAEQERAGVDMFIEHVGPGQEVDRQQTLSTQVRPLPH